MLDYQLLDHKIAALAEYAQELTTEQTPKNAELWREFWALSLDIFESFKTAQYPTKEEKDVAWAGYNVIKNNANALKTSIDEQVFVDIDNNIQSLENKVEALGASTQITTYQQVQATFEPIMQLAEQTKALMRNVRFPNREDREMKYERVQKLQVNAKDYRRILLDAISEIVFNDLIKKIKDCSYDAQKDVFYTEISFDALKTASETMKRRQSDLRNAVAEFSNLKTEMHSEDKSKIIAALDEVRATHNVFWETHHKKFDALKQEKDKEYADKHQNYLDKQAAFKRKIAENIERNKDRVFKATEFRNKQEEQVQSLQNKLIETESGIYADRLNAWLLEAQTRVKEGNEQIERLQKFIDEDTLKLQDLNN